MKESPEDKITRVAAQTAQRVLDAAATARAVLDTEVRLHISSTDQSIAEINAKLDKKYVTQEAFLPIQRVVYGLVALILTGVVTALIVLVIK
jgi:hypothetical protein